MSASASPASLSPSPVVLRGREGSIAILTLNRPAARNSLSLELIDDLHAALNEARDDSTVRGVVIAAAGPAFCAGHDLKQLNARHSDPDGGRAYFAHTMAACSDMMQAIIAMPKPVIAAVQGIATAAGCQLVASCDLALASGAAGFATPGVDIGLFCSTPMVALTRNVPRKHAMEMLLTGETISADRAREMGLVNRVVPAAEVLPTALALAERIAANGPLALRVTKELMYAEIGDPDRDALAAAVKPVFDSDDAREGARAFAEKRAPHWTGH